MKRYFGLLLPVLITLAGLAVLFSLPARGIHPAQASVRVPDAGIVVNTLEDELNSDGDCSLREAVQAANTNLPVDACPAGSGYDSITLPPGIYTLSIPGVDDANVAGDLDILDPLNIQGDNANNTIIDGNELDRVINIHGVTVELHDIKIQNGYALGGNGGGILNQDGTLTVTRSIIRDNLSGYFGGGIMSQGYLYLEGSQIIGNISGEGHSGGGIEGNGVSVILNNIIKENTSAIGGGFASWGGNVIMSGNTIFSNNATLPGSQAGGGVFIDGVDAMITNNLIFNNSDGAGGLVTQNVSVTLTNNLIFQNNSNGLEFFGSSVNLINNIIYENQANGLIFIGGSVYLINNIIYENQGNGLIFAGSFGRLMHNTIARNFPGVGISVMSYYGDELWHCYSSNLVLTNTIIVSHTQGIFVPDDCWEDQNQAVLEATLWGDGGWANGQDWGGDDIIITGTINIWGQPGFHDYTNDDYHITVASDAVDAGIDAGVYTDFDSEVRPVGEGFDIGADELMWGVYLHPSVQGDFTVPGEVVSYTIELSSFSDITDTYSLWLSPHTWETNLSTDTIGPILPPGGSQTFTVEVTIPTEADWFKAETITITATSVTSPTEYAAATQVTTEVYAPPQISVSHTSLRSTQYAGEATTQTLIISNGYGVTLTYTLATGIPSNGLVVYYPFNGNADDESLSGNDGVIMGPALTTDRFGNPNSAFSFNGIDTYIYRDYSATSGLFPTEAPFAISAWFKTSATSPEEQVIASTHYANVGDGYLIKIDSYNDSRIRCIFDTYNQEVQVFSAGSVNDGQWHHVVCMWAEDMVYLYVDAELQDSTSAVGTVAYPNQARFKIGHTDTVADDWKYFFNGSIDDVTAYNRALTEEEIQDLYQWPDGSDVPWLTTTPVSGTVPTDSSVPIQVTFDAMDPLPGMYTTILHIISNDPLNPFVTIPVTMTVLEPGAPLSVDISGPEEGLVGQSYLFTAGVSPISTTLPVEYTWQASGQAPITHTGGITDTVTFTWQSPGNQIITVTATNVAGYVMDAHAITITNPSYIRYLPILLKEEQAGSPAPGTKAGTVGFIAALFSGGTGVGWWLRRCNQRGNGNQQAVQDIEAKE